MKKKAVSLLLIFALLIPCAIFPGYAADQDELVGRWEAEIDLAAPITTVWNKMFAMMLEESLGISDLPTIGGFIGPLPVSVYLEFHSDGTVESGLVDAEGEMEALNRQLEVAMRHYYNVLLEQLLPLVFAEELGVQITSLEDLEEHLGMTLDEFFLASTGMSLDEVIEMSFEESVFPAGTDYLQEFGLYDICYACEWEGEYAVKNGQIYFESDSDSCYFTEFPPYYELSRQGLSLYLSETKARKDMTLDDIRALDESIDVYEIFPAELSMNEEDALQFLLGMLGLVYDLTYTRA